MGGVVIETESEKILRKGKKEERMEAIERMIRAGATKEQIISYGYTEEEYEEVEEDANIHK